MIVIDAIDGAVARLEIEGSMVTVSVELLPEGAKEGDILQLSPSDTDASEMTEESAARLERLRKRDDGANNIDL